MARGSKIGWTDTSWNPVTGCSKVSPGCDNCYAETFSERKRGTPAFPVGFDLQLRPHKLRDPLKWKQPERIFVNSMSDLFHVDVPDEFIRQVWETMLIARQHTYQILTKRPHRMAHKVEQLGLEVPPHIWLGTSVENQEFADNRIPPLLGMGIEVPWISAEPLIGPVDLSAYLGKDGLAWVVVGGESGPRRRNMDFDWVRRIRDQCAGAGVPLYFKQGNHVKPGQDRVLDGVTHDEYPEVSAPDNPIEGRLF